MDLASKLNHLLTHWVEHNEAHLQTYREWAERARDEGHVRTGEQLEEAIRAVEAVSYTHLTLPTILRV